MTKLSFALTHPAFTARYLGREFIRRYRRTTVKQNHQPRTLNGQILASGILGKNHKQFSYESAARRIINGELCLYGHAIFQIGNKINWQRDYLSGFTWPKSFSLDINYQYPRGVDIKNPWELSRGHHLVIVALAYKETGDQIFARYVAETLSSWITNNPFYYGVNWKVAMEVGIRAVNWLTAYELLEGSPVLTTDFRRRLLGSLAEHRRFILENLEFFGVKSNHYFSDLVGLIWINLLCPDLPGAKAGLKKAKQELEREILHQFYEDGWNFEGSIAYHRLVLEMASYTALLLKNYKQPLAKLALQRLSKAFTVILNSASQKNLAPQFGDNDTGRLLITENYHSWPSLDFSSLFQVGKQLFGDLKTKETYWPSGGLMVQRSGNWQLNASLIPIGQDGNGGHNHDDAGSFTLFYGGEPIVVDPGTATYTSDPPRRNRFRSAEVHNAPTVKGKIHQMPPLLFVGNNFTQVKRRVAKNDQIILKLKAEKYQVRREMGLTRSGLTITDQIVSPPSALIQTLITLAANLKVTKTTEGFMLGEKILLTIEEGKGQVVQAEYSPAYAQVVPTKAVLISAKQKIKFSILLAK